MQTNLILLCLGLLLPVSMLAQDGRRPVTHVQIVNATSVPEISMEVNGEMLYPAFLQGKRTSGGATPRLNASYKVTDPRSGKSGEASFRYAPNIYNILILTGDFSTEADPSNPAAKDQHGKPNIRFHLFQSEPLEAGQKPRYRFLNGVPGVSLRLGEKELPPGAELELEAQPAVVNYQFSSEAGKLAVVINQEEVIRNCTVTFYKSDKGIQFVRAFENSPLSEQQRDRLSEGQ